MKKKGRLPSMGWGSQQRFCCLFFLQALLIIHNLPSADSTLGVVYGYNADVLPLPSQVVQLLANNQVTKVRVDFDDDILKAFVGSNIEVIVGIPNTLLAIVGASNLSAYQWVNSSIIPYATSVNITGIAVGREVFTIYPAFTPSLIQTMVWVHDALILSGINNRIQVSTMVSTAALQSNFPPSQSTFNETTRSTVQTLLQFLNITGYPFMLNVHTFDVFQTTTLTSTLPYAMFEGAASPVRDAYSNLNYTSLFDALVDATYYAMGQLGFTTIPIVVTETGWPSYGDANQNGANVTNAQTYNNNLALKVINGTGTPARPRVPVTPYVYSLFNEDLNQGPTSVRNFGLFTHNLTAVYSVDLTGGQGRFLTSNGTEYQTWCVAVSNASPQNLQSALDWACGPGGVNCSETLLGGNCYDPNTLSSHASWVFNAYYQSVGNAANSCDFNGVAQVVAYNPSYGNCFFPPSNVTTTVNGGALPPTTPDSANSHQMDLRAIVTLSAFVFLFIQNFRQLLE